MRIRSILILFCLLSLWLTAVPAFPQVTMYPVANEPIPPLNNNPISNARMNVWQRGTSFAAMANGTYMSDRFKAAIFVTGALATGSRSTNVPTIAQSGQLFNYSLDHTVTTADATVGATELYAIQHTIEGYNWQPYAQRNFILSFWVRDTVTGEHAVSLLSSGQDRSFIGVYYVNTADTWELKSISVPASPSTGTWDYVNGAGLRIYWGLLVGSNFQGTAGSWQSNASPGVYATATTVNSVATNANVFRITGVKLQLGNIATPINPITFNEELFLCMRYYQKSFLYATAPVQNAGANTGEFVFPAMLVGALAERSGTMTYQVPMRTAPTPTLFNPSAANAQVRDETGAVDTTATAVVGASERGFAVSATGNAATAVGNLLGVHWTSNSDF